MEMQSLLRTSFQEVRLYFIDVIYFSVLICFLVPITDVTFQKDDSFEQSLPRPYRGEIDRDDSPWSKIMPSKPKFRREI